MATYTELYALTSDSALRNRVAVAAVVAADAIRTEAVETANRAARMVWAAQALGNPTVQAERLMWLILAQNKAQTIATIQAATDAVIQAAVDGAVNLLAQ